MKELIDNLGTFGIKPVSIDEDFVEYSDGYESYEFYNAILNTVKERLYVFGRKNRKLFTRNNSKIKNIIDSGIDFKCLFLSDKSNSSILKMAQDKDDFLPSLQKIINSVKEKYKDNLECFKKYDFQQIKRIIIVDDCVIFVPVSFENGKVKHFTKTSFLVYKANSLEGINLISEFKKVWDISKSL